METRGDVHLQEPGLELGVQEDVEAKELEAGVSAGHVVVVEADEAAFGTDNSLYHQVFDLLPDGGVIDPGGVKVSPQGLEGPLVSLQMIGVRIGNQNESSSTFSCSLSSLLT